MQRLFSLLLTLVISTTLVLTVCGSEATAKQNHVFKLRLATWYPAEHHLMSGLMKQYIKNLEERSNGRLKIEYYPAGQLANLKQTLEACSTGAVDITGVVPQIMSGQLPLNTFITLPFWTTAVEGTEIYQKTYEAVPQLSQEFARYGLRMLGAFTCSQYDIGTVNKPVRSPQDLKGLKIAVTGGFMNKIAARYGIDPVTIGPTELYEALHKNIIDGTCLSHVSTNGYKVYEVEKYLTNGLRMGSVVTDFVINEKSWRKLPKDLQLVVFKTTQELAKNAAVNWDRESSKLLEKFRKAGVTIYTISPKQRDKWSAPLKGIGAEWVKDMADRGLPAQKTYDEFMKVSKQVTQ